MMESFPSDGLKISWRVPVGPGWSSPIVVQGRIYLTDVELARPSARERVLCYDEADGKQVWSHAYAVDYPAWAFEPSAGGPRSTPICRDGKLFTLGALGHLLCLDADSGKPVWEKDLAKEYGVKEFTGITASPLIEGDLLILQICARPGAGVVALDLRTGKEAWKALDDSFSYSSPVVLTAGGTRQLIAWTQDAVTSLAPETGRIWWREQMHTPGDMAVSTPVFADGRLLIAGLMMQLDAGKPGASVLWPEKTPVSRRILSNTSTALLKDGCVFSAKTSGELVCLRADTGQEVWRTNSVTRAGNGSCIHLTPCGEAVFLFTDQGDLIRAQLSVSGYSETGRVHLLEPTSPFGGRKCAWTPPAFANRHIVVRNDKELLRASLAAHP